MARKVILDVDPGVADAVALCLALFDPKLEVVAVTATGGNVGPKQATLNVQALVEQLDPQRWPRVGAADPDQLLVTDGREYWGEDGLCGANFRIAELHHRHSAVKLISDEIKTSPGEITIVAGGPMSNIATVLQREPDLAMQVGHLFIVGGTLAGPGNVTPTAEFNVYCDCESARSVFLSPITKTLLPLDVSSKVVLRYDLLDRLPDEKTNRGRVLRKLLPGALRSSHERLGIEGLLVPEAVAIVGILHPELLTTERLYCDVETSGELTRGMTVIDRRRNSPHQPNMDVVVDINVEATIDCILRGLK
ncbi:nucleoside hydrolase [Bythopirellula goksoeyrii]|uniref:Pyrimidine-specific ribonucleoside hydrolase RihA n=1 Tax=Bythopirellula goksoeyrii TaxID=1400387 RepID=A0A5B9QGB5_9BACT|nr:nucleoside hydrolase [Bythopirellula goksoeyrii]QEG36622.1 Pyrimidine-specific ribonucleoside hydrolase RihA [Bythopirellula goksoeyrii]